MGLASKMAAAKVQGAPSGYPGAGASADPRPTYPGQQQQPVYNPQKTPAASYQAYQPPQQQSYGGQPGYPPQQSYGGPSSAVPPAQVSRATDPELLFAILQETSRENGLGSFYDDGRLRALAASIGRSDPVTNICQRWDIPLEIAFDLVKLALYDIVFLVDDSGSIEFSKLQGELKSLLKSAALASSLFDQDGFSVRFLNSNVEGDNIRTEAQAEDLVNRVRFQGVTPLVTALRDKILRNYLGEVHEPTPNIKKPLLVIIITDGMPTDSPGREFQRLIKDYKVKPVAFQIAQVGVDLDAQDFLASLDTDPEVGSLIDCTSNFEMESAEFRRMTNMPLSRELWYTKLLLGSIDSTYDKKDEKEARFPPVPSKPSYGGQGGQGQGQGGQGGYYQPPANQYPPTSYQQQQQQQYGHQQQQYPPPPQQQQQQYPPPQQHAQHGQQGQQHGQQQRGMDYGYQPSYTQYLPPQDYGAPPPPQGGYYRS